MNRGSLVLFQRAFPERWLGRLDDVKFAGWWIKVDDGMWTPMHTHTDPSGAILLLGPLSPKYRVHTKAL